MSHDQLELVPPARVLPPRLRKHVTPHQSEAGVRVKRMVFSRLNLLVWTTRYAITRN